MKKNAFTLIELSIVLVIIGLIIGGSFKVLKSMRENAKITNAKDNVKAAKNAVIGNSIINRNTLPDKTFFQKNLSPIKNNQHPLLYEFATDLDKNNICALTTTDLNVTRYKWNNDKSNEEKDKIIQNVAFIIASRSLDNYMQTEKVNHNVDYHAPFIKIGNHHYDDIVDWVTLSQLKNTLKCENVIKLITNHIPVLDENISKKVEIFTDDYEPINYNWSIKLKKPLSIPSLSSIQYLCNGTLSSTHITATGWSPKEECTSFVLDINFTTNELSNRVDINVSQGPNSALRSYAIGLR